jgi:hypothetical protein
MFNLKLESRNKITKSLPKYYVFCFLLFLCFELSSSTNFLGGPKVAVKDSKMAMVFGFWRMWP